MIERLTKEIGMVNKLKPHTFRHTFCTRLINGGVPISTVSKLAGHSSVDTTRIFYINSSREDKLKAVIYYWRDWRNNNKKYFRGYIESRDNSIGVGDE